MVFPNPLVNRVLASLDDKIRTLRTELGARWSVVLLLLAPGTFGILHFGGNAFVVIAVSVMACMAAGVLQRVIGGQTFAAIHANSIVSGLLLGFTLSPNTPLSMILVGALITEFLGRQPIPGLGRTIFNPALLGRAAIAVLETIDPVSYDSVDIISSASVLFKTAGGHPQPSFSDAFLGLTKGSVGEISAIILLVVGGLLLRYVVIKREATLAMLITVPIAVFLLPPSVEIIGHAPWVANPFYYVVGGSTLLMAFFFASDPVTTPQTPLGGIVFGVGAGVIGVAGKFYTAIPGCDMYGILIMNLATPLLDRLFSRANVVVPTLNIDMASFYAERGCAMAKLGPMEGYSSSFATDGDFSVFRALIDDDDSPKVFAAVAQADLRGAGGGAFPVTIKWRSLLAAPILERTLIVNGLEGEPETVKDRFLMENCPRTVIEGAAIAAHTLGISTLILVINAGYVASRDRLAEAVAAFISEFAGRVAFSIELQSGPESELYVCGEETALLEFLEDRRAEPRLRPPLPTQRGLHGRPTLIHNVETLCWLPVLLAHPERKGRKLTTLYGAVGKPGVYEVALGVPVREVIALADPVGRVKAVLIGGASGGFLPAAHLNVAFAHANLAAEGCPMGTGSINIFNAQSDLQEEVVRVARFLEAETCGRCTPCRVGVQSLRQIAESLDTSAVDRAFVNDLAATMRDTSSCGFGVAAPTPLVSYLKHFGGEE